MILKASFNNFRTLLLSKFSSVGIAALVTALASIPGLFGALAYYPDKLANTLTEKIASVNAVAEANKASIQTQLLQQKTKPISTVFIEATFVTNVSRELHSLAEKSNVKISRISMKDDRNSSTLPRNIEIQLSVEGSYPQIRQLAMSSLNKIDALAIQSLEFKRRPQSTEQNAGAKVEAQINMRLFVINKS
jgi:hypothetical protein